MPADIYQPEEWGNFFVMVGGGVAALTGLVFVALSTALSLNLDEMTKEATHKYRSINTLAGLTAVFLSFGLVLMPGQDHTAGGGEGIVRLGLPWRHHFSLRLPPSLQVRISAVQGATGDRRWSVPCRVDRR